MKIRTKKKIAPIHLAPEDSIHLHYQKGNEPSVEVLKSKVVRPMVVNEAVIFDVEKGDFGENVEDGIGGAFLSTKERSLI